MAEVGRPPQAETQERQSYRLPAVLIRRLADEKRRTGVPTAEFVRRAIEAALPRFAVGDKVVTVYGDNGVVVDFIGVDGKCFYVELSNGNSYQYQASELVKVATRDNS